MKEQYTYKFTDKGLEEYVKSIREAAVLAEREACAKMCYQIGGKFYLAGDDLEGFGADECAEAIRNRSNK